MQHLGDKGMKALLSVMSALAVAATLMLPTTVTASAQDRTYGSSNLYAQVDYRRDGRRYGPPRHYRGGREWRHGGRHHGPRYRHGRRSGPSFNVIIGGGSYYRPAPRYIAPPARPVRPAYGVSRAHIDWCYSRYRSYRASDNSFQPYNGPRRACYSPYS
jgi:hypothetical protein